VKEAREALAPLGFTDYEFYQWACVAHSPETREAYLWMRDFFELVGDWAPNRDNKVQLPGMYTKESIHHIFQHHVKTIYSGNEHDPLELSQFRDLWKNVFPNVTISKYCQVSGKCSR
jgi:hypothetical protein